LKKIKIYINHENEAVIEGIISLLSSFEYTFFCRGKEMYITRIEFKKEGS